MMKETGYNIKGLRSYTVSNIPKGSIGGKEWHKARSEYLYVPSGSATVQCIDLAGDEKTFTVTSKQAIIIPPGILHTYTALEDNTKLQVICNTLFIPNEPGTHDSFLPDEFYKLIEKTKNASSH